MDHVRLGEDRATAGDRGGFAGLADDVAHVFDVVQQPVGLLVHERARARRAVAVGAVVGDAHAACAGVGLEVDELGGLAAHLEDGGDVGVERADGAGDSPELVLVGQVEQFADQTATSAGDARMSDDTLGQGLEHLADELAGRFGGAALDAQVLGRQDGRSAGMGEDPVLTRRLIEESAARGVGT